MTWENLLKKDSFNEQLLRDLQAKEAKQPQKKNVPYWGKSFEIVSGQGEKLDNLKIVGKTVNPKTEKEVNVYSGGIVLESEWME
tara:strand:- start:252 stop:503 length:252 start_codon:yes stop_codon:yes gene_type:complete